MKTAYLEVTTYVGTSMVWYAEHYYGRIMFGKKKVEVTAPLTKTDAARLNKGERYKDPVLQSEYKAGEESGRFYNKNKLIKAAITLFNEDSHGYEALLLGESPVCDPMLMLIGPIKAMEKANRLHKEFEEYDGWNADRNHWPVLEAISEKWESLVGDHCERA